jgi:hypothetical protein
VPTADTSDRTARSLAARLDTEWRCFTPLHEHALEQARAVASGAAGPYAGAIVGVYGSGKSTLAFTLLREAPGLGAVALWDEAAPFVDRLVPAGESVLPQTFAARVLAWAAELLASRPALARYSDELARRGHPEIARAVRAQVERGARRVVLLLDEVEQAHELLRKRIAADDGQPLRALIDACGPDFRLLLSYAPESYHSVGDADRGRLAYLPVPALDVASIQASLALGRGEANFVWWASRGRARGVLQAVRSVIEPLRRGAFDRGAGLQDLGDALDALPGVFGVPAVLRAGASHAETRALLDLVPVPSEGGERGIVCPVADRSGLADRIRAELARRVATGADLLPVASELVAVLSAVADEDDRAWLTLDDFCAALRAAEARAIESGRQREPIERFASQAALIFTALGEMGPLRRRLRVPLATLAEDRFPSPFTDPYLPLEGGRAPSEPELERRFRELARLERPLLVSSERDCAVFASADALGAWIDAGGLDAGREPVRAVLLAGGASRPASVALAEAAGRLCVLAVGPFHATFLKCLSLLGPPGAAPAEGQATASAPAPAIEAFETVLGRDRQLARKVSWHLDRISLLLREVKPRPSPAWTAASRFIRDEQFRGALGRLKGDSPALLGLLLPLSPPPPSDRRLLARLARLCDAKGPLRRVARTVNPGGRLSGAAVVVDELLPLGAEAPRWTERKLPGADDLVQLLGAFAGEPGLLRRLAHWLFPEDPQRLEALFGFHAGALPDISEEQGQLEALQGLERTVRRAGAILADLEECTGRSRDSLRGLRLGAITDQVRANGGPIEQLRVLGAELRAEAPGQGAAALSWARQLALWISGVFAHRLLSGVEKEQAELSEWEAAGAAAREVGARAQEVERELLAVGAEACAELVRLGRRRLGNHVETRESLAREVSLLRGTVGGLGSLARSLQLFSAALAERGQAVAQALAAFLPDEDLLKAHEALLRRVPELLEGLEGPCPPPQGRGLIEYAELLRRHAEAGRRERLRLRLEAALDITVASDLPLDEAAVAAIERTWAALPEPIASGLRAELSARGVRDADTLERWLHEGAAKAQLVAGWAARPAPLLREADERAARWSLHVEVGPEQVRELDRRRSRVRELLLGLPGLLGKGVAEALVAGACEPCGGEVEPLYSRVEGEVLRFANAVSGLLDQLRAAGAAPPDALAAGTPQEALDLLQARVTGALAERDAILERARELGAALGRWGLRAAAIPAEVNLPQAARLVAREEERLVALLRERREGLASWLSKAGLPAALLPAEGPDVLASCSALEAARDRCARLEPLAGALLRLGETAPRAAVEGPLDWEAAQAALRERHERAVEEQRALARRTEAAALRVRRLGGAPSAQPVEGLTLAAARSQAGELEREVERLRALRLRDCSAGARAAYAAIRSGDAGALPASVAELLRLGLLRTIEDAR